MFKIIYKDQEYTYINAVKLGDFQKEVNDTNGVIALVNHKLKDLDYYVDYNCNIDFLGKEHYLGCHIYETSLRFLVRISLKDMNPNYDVSYYQFISQTICGKIINGPSYIDDVFIKSLKDRMHYYTDNDIDIERIGENNGQVMYKCGDHQEEMFGLMVPSMGYLKDWNILEFNNRLVLQSPRSEKNGQLPLFQADDITYFRMLEASEDFSDIMGIHDISELNQYVHDHSVDLVNLCETKQANDLAEIGELVVKRLHDIKIIAIAGPSSSGKTTTSNKLRLELMSRGIKPIRLSLDDFYVERVNTPLDENGKPDYESLYALDIPLFNQIMVDLTQGKEVTLPRYNFKTGKREEGFKAQLTNDKSVIIIEGNHALNPKLLPSFSRKEVFHLYISPTPSLQINHITPIRASEIRKLRRIVRDETFRHISAEKTILSWSDVRAGEVKWIYPFMKYADYVLNTSLLYELCVMKKHALNALKSIEKDSSAYIEAQYLIHVLDYVKDIDDKIVPNNSTIREFIGDSVFFDSEGVLQA